VEVSGGGALGSSSASIPVTFSSTGAGLGFSNFDGWLSNADGTADTQAGSHPYSLTIAFSANSQGLGANEELPTVGMARPRCTLARICSAVAVHTNGSGFRCWPVGEFRSR
jgi:hypothetical protein